MVAPFVKWLAQLSPAGRFWVLMAALLAFFLLPWPDDKKAESSQQYETKCWADGVSRRSVHEPVYRYGPHAWNDVSFDGSGTMFHKQGRRLSHGWLCVKEPVE